MGTLLLSVAVLAVADVPTDTIVALERGDRIVVENIQGEISVRTWSQNRLEVATSDDDDRRGGVSIRRAAGRVTIGPDQRKGRGRVDGLELRVPEWADVEISGRQLDVDVRGVGGALRIANVTGDIYVSDTRGPVSVRSIEGEVTVSGARGSVVASSRGDDVHLMRVEGDVEVDSGSGDILLEDIDARSVRAETQDGDISFSGRLARGGSYGFFVHDGDAFVALPADVGAQVSVSTFDGEFQSEFPVVLQRFTGGREFEFTLGDGGARLQIQVFDGEIRLLRR